MPNEGSSGGGLMGTLKSKFGPLPVWGWLALVTVLLLGYWLYAQHKAGGSTQQQQPTPGDVGQPGVVVINQDGPDVPQGTGPPPPPEKKPKPKKGKTREITVESDETLGELAKQRHWSSATLAQVEQMNLTQGQGKWTASTRLKKGDTVIRPLRG